MKDWFPYYQYAKRHKIFLSVFSMMLSSAHAQTWQPLGTGCNNDVLALYFDTTTNLLYAGGTFTTAGDSFAPGLAVWDGTSWSTFANWNSGTIYTITKYDSLIVMNGGITWDGSNIGYLALNINGDFTHIAGISAYRIAVWDGATWSTLGSGFSYGLASAEVRALCVFNGELYAGGSFEWSGTDTVRSIARWDSSSAQWQPVGTGIRATGLPAGTVLTMAKYNNELYVGGAFDSCGSIYCRNIGKWNGSSWDTVRNNLFVQVDGMKECQGKFYAGGGGYDFSLGDVLTFDGQMWESTGFGIPGTVMSLEAADSTLYVGGSFGYNGDSGIATNIAMLDLHSIPTFNQTIIKPSVKIFPDPVSDQLFIQSKDNSLKKVYLINLLGEVVLSIDFQNSLTVDVRKFSSGLYMLQIFDRENRQLRSEKIIKE